MVDQTSQPFLGLLSDSNPLKQGFNSFVCNTYHYYGDNTSTVSAQNNWWGAAPPDPGQFYPPANLDYSNYLSQEAAPPGGSRTPIVNQLRVARGLPPANIVLTWETIGLNCGYDVYRGTSAGDPGSFVLISGPGPVYGNTFTDTGAAQAGNPDYFYQVYVH
jgi:hypothetical protein